MTMTTSRMATGDGTRLRVSHDTPGAPMMARNSANIKGTTRFWAARIPAMTTTDAARVSSVAESPERKTREPFIV